MASDSSKQTALTVRIVGRDYAVSCPENERASLLRSAEHLSRRMSAIQRQGKTRSTERVAVIAALNIARDLLDLQRAIERGEIGANSEDESMRDRLAQLQLSIANALGESG